MCVCIRILSAACVSRRHTPISPGTRQFPDRSPKFGIVDRRSFTDLKVPMWNRQNHIFPLRHNLAIDLIFLRIESFPVMKEFNLSQSFKAFVLEVSKANRQPSTSTNRRTLLVRLSLPAGLSKLESRSFLLLLFVSWSGTSHVLRFH